MALAEVVEIGFSGGQVIAVRLEPATLEDLRKSLQKANGWSDLDTPNGTVSLDLRQVVFVRTDAPSQSVGFSG